MDRTIERLQREVDELTGICVAQDIVLHELLVIALREGHITAQSFEALRDVPASILPDSSGIRGALKQHLAHLLDDARDEAEHR